MRIAYICSDFGIPIFSTKGSAVHVRELARAFSSLGCDIHILAARTGGDPPQGWRIPVHDFKLDGWPAVIQDFLSQEAPTPDWERMQKDWRSLAYAQNLVHAAQPLLQCLRPDVIYERYSLFAWSGQALAARLGLPHILEINAPLAIEQAQYRQLSLKVTASRLEAQILSGADLIVAVSGAVRDYAVGLGAEPERVVVLPNGVDIQRFSPEIDSQPVRRALGLTNAFVIGFVGGLKAWHGVGNLLTAAAGLPGSLPWRLLIVGDGPKRASLAEQAFMLNISDRVVFTGSMPNEHIPAYLAAMDVTVAPYPVLDNFYFSPLKLFEYMAMARPVIAADIGQIAEIITHQQNGWLYPPDDVCALSEALLLLASDKNLRDELGASARAYVAAHHTWIQDAEMLVNWMSKLPHKQTLWQLPIDQRLLSLDEQTHRVHGAQR